MTPSRFCDAHMYGRIAVSIAFAIAAILTVARPAKAQEDNISPPPPLQFPLLAGPNATGQIPFQLSALAGLRFNIEQAGNLGLCEALMTQAGQTIPPGLTFDQCSPSIQQQVNNNQGMVTWADNARPTQCGRDCVGPPFMSQTLQLTQPNYRFGF